MKRRLLDLLACPSCLNFPLKLIVEYEDEVDGLPSKPERPLCEKWCAFMESEPSDPALCVECMKKDVLSGKLVCEKCGAEYFIEAGVPRMLRPSGSRQS
ncbi:MAG: Trm112 family protein [Candidatus Korarchaeota archaeon]|nr:Trm112 family protein [Candidatus Korarchaeota archaeon]